MVLHPLENNRSIALFGLDDRILYFKVCASIHALNLGLQQTLDGLIQRLLYLTDTNASAPLVNDVLFNHQFGKGVGLARTPAAPCTLVSAWACQWDSPPRGVNLQCFLHPPPHAQCAQTTGAHRLHQCVLA